MDSILDSGILRNCSLLTLCIMTHGYRGVFSGSHRTEIPVNNFLNQLSVSLPDYLPLVSMCRWPDFLNEIKLGDDCLFVCLTPTQVIELGNFLGSIQRRLSGFVRPKEYQKP